MQENQLTESQKKELLRETLGTQYHKVGNHFPTFSRMIDNLGRLNDAASAAELIPVLSRYLSGPASSAFFSTASFIGTLLFPFQQMINLINANQTGHRMYSYRSVAYTITAWAFDQPIPKQSQRILLNIRSGRYQKPASAKQEYNKIWLETSRNVLNEINRICESKNIEKAALKKIFRVMGNNKPDKLSVFILKSFEPQFGHTTKHIWRGNYSIVYPN